MVEPANRYRHVVLFEFHPGTPEATLRSIETAFLALCRGLSFVQGFEWGRNSSPEQLDHGFTHCFIVTFAGPGDRDAYLVHPDHVAFCRRHLDPNLKQVCVVDFTPEPEPGTPS